jgi:o-succinylbenzoate synthase
MKIERLELAPYALPFRKPYVAAPGTLERREIVLVRLRCEGGTVGLGEAVPLSLRGRAPLAVVLHDLEGVRDVLEGATISDEALGLIHARCMQRLEQAPAMAAIDQALLDLHGKLRGEPAWKVLGAREAKPVHCNATLVAGPPDEVVADALNWVEAGFDCLKLKLGAGDDLATVAAVREAVGTQVKLRIDVNGAWTVNEASDKLAELAEYGIELAEQPVATLEQLAEARRQTPIPIVADESVADAGEAGMAVALAACDATTIKLAKVGGSIAARDIARQLPAYMSSALDGPVGIAAAAHIAQALPGTTRAHGLATQRLFSEWPANLGPLLYQCRLSLPAAPGLGVELYDAALAELRIDAEA